MTWWYVPLALVGATWLWHPFKYALVSYRAADLLCLINNPFLRWPMGLGFGIFYLVRGRYLLTGLAVFWPLAVIILMQICPPTKNGILQSKFAAQILGEEM
ncbi:hypothetical protein ACFL1R_13315 [Candidatus Latescibacterota bacterium]